MAYFKFFLIIFFSLFGMGNICKAEMKELVITEGKILSIAPPIVNKDYFLLEFGYLLEKKKVAWNYYYNAYVSADLFEDGQNLTDNLKAGGLGFKGGVFLPFEPWWPLLFSISGGYAKTVLHDSPLFGRDAVIKSKKDMVLIELGLLYHYEKYLIRFNYQKTNVHYFNRSTFISFGVNY